MHWIYLIHEFHNLSWITEINILFHNILIYWDAPVFAFHVGLGRWTLLSGMLIHFMLRYPKAPHQRPQPPLWSLLTGLCYRRVAGMHKWGVWIWQTFVCPPVLFCFYRGPIWKKEGGRGQNSKRQFVQGIFASSYGSLFKGVKKGSRYFFNSLSEAPSSFSLTTPTLVITFTLTFPVCLLWSWVFFCPKHFLFLSRSVYHSWFRFGLQQSDDYNKYKIEMSCISHTVNSLKLTANKNSYS